MQFHVVTLFPEVIEQYCNTSILGRAQKNKILSVKAVQLRDFANNKWGKVDERAYGGGPGMVLRAEPIVKAVQKIIKQLEKRKSSTVPTSKNTMIYHSAGTSRNYASVLQNTSIRKTKTKVLITSAGGKPLTNTYAKNLAKKYTDIILVCGRYEGIDARARKMLRAEEVSAGNYILTGGEIPALAIIDATARHIPGVLGKIESLEESRVASHEIYTRPEILEWDGKKYRVPKVLLSGHHAKIDELRSKKRSKPQ